MDRKIQKAGVEKELEPEEYQRLNDILASFPVRNTLNWAYDSLEKMNVRDAYTRGKIYSRIANHFKRYAREIYLATDEEMKQKLREELELRVQGVMGRIEVPSEDTQHYTLDIDLD
jgi:hypothetical protein